MKKGDVHHCDHIGIFTNNADRLIRFYTRVMGFEKTQESILEQRAVSVIFSVPSVCRFVKLNAGRMMIEIFEPRSAELRKRINNIAGYNHWGYSVPDKANFIKWIKREKTPIIELKRNDHTVYFVVDPDGNRIEIRQNSKSNKKGGDR